MQNLRSLLMTAAGIAAALTLLLFAATLGLFLAAMAGMLAIGSLASARISRKPARATVRSSDSGRTAREPRIWNDGRGTIIDL